MKKLTLFVAATCACLAGSAMAMPKAAETPAGNVVSATAASPAPQMAAAKKPMKKSAKKPAGKPVGKKKM